MDSIADDEPLSEAELAATVQFKKGTLEGGPMRYTKIVVRLAVTLFTGALLVTETQTLVSNTATAAGALSSWSIVSSPDHGTATNDLYAVSCPPTSSCHAVGSDR